MTHFAVKLPFPPSVNGLFAHGIVKGKVRRFPTKAYKAWQREAWVAIKQARHPRFKGKVRVVIEFVPPNKRPRDPDNFNKAVLDSLVKSGVIVDDNNQVIVEFKPLWKPSGPAPGAFVTVEDLEATNMPTDKRQKLTKYQSSVLGKLKTQGPYLIGPTEKAVVFKRLVQKGYAEELPGLIEGVPQGYVAK